MIECRELQGIDKTAIRRFVQRNTKPRSISSELAELAIAGDIEAETNDGLENTLETTQIPVNSEIWIDKLLSILQQISPDLRYICTNQAKCQGFAPF